MRYNLIWRGAASHALAESWIESPSELRESITSGVALAEAALRTFPLDAGESRADGRRMLIVLPVAVTFVVVPDDMSVFVESFRLIRRQHP
jgi:hypothetical protein